VQTKSVAEKMTPIAATPSQLKLKEHPKTKEQLVCNSMRLQNYKKKSGKGGMNNGQDTVDAIGENCAQLIECIRKWI